ESEHLQDLVQQCASEMDSSSTDPRTLTLKPAELFLPEKFTTVSNSDSVLSDRSLSLEATKLKEIIEPLLVSASTIAQERHIDFSFHIWPNLPPVRANAGAVREVLSNLIDNALKYTPAGGKVEIEAGIEQPTAGGNWQGISVSDTGSGIPSEDIDRIFERHYRGIQARGDIPGSGLGLAIAKELIEQMHGKIELISPNRATHNVSLAKDAAAGSGTTFIVWLPVATD
ncbi:MAG: sensor histidine kinase, partial [Prochloraceae cyanobacterium]